MRLNPTLRAGLLASAIFVLGLTAAKPAGALTVTYQPYLQLGDNGPFGTTDQILVAWQTDEPTPNPSNYLVSYGVTTSYGSSVVPAGRIVDNYLAADPALPAGASPYGAHTNYSAVLPGLTFDTTYYYKVTGPGLDRNGFTASFHTRKQGNLFSFIVQGDEGMFPADPNTSPATVVNYEARIAHEMYDSASLTFTGQPARPPADFYLNTGDNIYTYGSEDNYRDFFFPVMNNNADSNETGAPILRNYVWFVAPGNHDLGSTGVNANLLSSDTDPPFSGSAGGGDALAYFNDLYYPLNGLAGYDVQQTWTGDASVPNGLLFSYLGQTYTSPAAIAAFRASTAVNSGVSVKRQVDTMTNYSFDEGNAHFLILDANPHLFGGLLPSSTASSAAPPVFPPYPTALGNWVINDLDSSKQTWKIVLFHQPSFSSGDATIVNNQMRAVAKILEDHGVNMVFNGHEHNYQRTYPIRATAKTAGPVSSTGGPAVYIDTAYDGTVHTVPDGVIYLVEGAGGNRDFDGDYAPPRGSGSGVDQDDSATGTYTPTPGVTVQQGAADWLDTNLTNSEMAQFVPGAGTGPKITVKFKSKVFSFGHLTVNNNVLTLTQITEPLQSTSSATTAIPAPYGTDINSVPLKDPIPDTILNATTGQLISASATGTPALLDVFSITKPEVTQALTAQLSAPPSARANGALVYSLLIQNGSPYPLNGTQVRLTIPSNVTLGSGAQNSTVQGSDVVTTIGRLAAGAQTVIQIKTQVAASAATGSNLTATASVTSGTALPVATNPVTTKIVSVPGLPAL